MAANIKVDDYHIDQLEEAVENITAETEDGSKEYLDAEQFNRLHELQMRLDRWMSKCRRNAP